MGLMALAVAAVTGVLLVQQSQNIDDVRSIAVERAHFQASVAANDIADAIALTETSVAGLAANPAVAELFTTEDPAGCAVTFTGAGPFVRGHIDIIDATGAVRCSSREVPGGPVYEGVDWLSAEEQDAITIGPTRVPTVDAPVVVVAAPIAGVGTVATILDLDAVEERLSATLGGQLDTNFDVLDAVEPSRSTPRAGGRIVGQAVINQLGWTIRTSIDEETVTADVNEHNRELLVLMLTAVVALIVASYFVYRAVVRPIERLSSAVSNTTAAGDMPSPPVSGPAEVAALTEAFSRLTDDVTAELALRQESERSYRTLFDAKPQPTWVHHPVNGAILEVNRAAESFFGRSRDELLSMRVDEFLPDQTAKELMELFAAEPRTEQSGPWTLAGRDGEPVECQITSVVLDLRGQPGRLVIAEDVTAQLRTQRRLQQAQRMESLGQLAGGIAHDFNNVLAVMLNYAEFVGEEVERAAEDDPQRWHPVVRDIEHIGEAGRRAAQLTQQLLSFARGKAAEIAPMDINDVVTEVAQMLRRTLGGETELVLSLAPDLSRITANEGQVQQVVLNLAVNARDAMPGGGRLLIETAEIDVDAEYAESGPGVDPGRHVRLRVSDTGIGMDAETRDRALEPFFTTKDQGTGTGLGLATVYGVVSSAGGTVRIYSEPGVGTSISVLFPVSDRADSQEAETHGPIPTRGSATVLVVDDDDDVREIAERVLTRAGYRVVTAPDGPSALTSASDRLPDIDLLLTDMVMPGMLGSELAVRLQELKPAIHVVFMSGYAPPLLLDSGMLPSNAAVIDKPFSGEHLAETVRDVLAATQRADRRT